MGLEWAILSEGVQTVVCSHWEVGADEVAAFLERFYDKWLLGSMSAAQAWQASIRELASKERNESLATHGGFSIGGDWR